MAAIYGEAARAGRQQRQGAPARGGGRGVVRARRGGRPGPQAARARIGSPAPIGASTSTATPIPRLGWPRTAIAHHARLVILRSATLFVRPTVRDTLQNTERFGNTRLTLNLAKGLLWYSHDISCLHRGHSS